MTTTPTAPRTGDPETPALTKRAVLYLRVSTARQATKNGEAEGYSIPQQRELCRRKADELGAQVIEEFVDAGASARSANRPELQRMLALLAEPDSGIDYVIIHKIDRLARDRADDVTIMIAIKNAGAALVSVAEQVDETPAGKLMHGIMASIAEYYSSNLATEAKKGMAQKARNGGTHGVAPIGYQNTIERSAAREIKGVALDEERAPHIRWAFTNYATGDWSISTIRDALEERGLKSRITRRYRGTPLNDAQVHRMLTNPYYMGKIVYQGVILDGAHEPMIDEKTWFRVQDVLAGRRIAGDRSWRHTHPLKGSLICARCGGRMGYGHSHGKGGTYTYFFCLGRHTGRTNCDLPYIGVEKIEQAVLSEWRARITLDDDTIDLLTHDARLVLDEQFHSSELLAKKQTTRLRELENTKQKLIDAYVADAIPVEDLKERQLAVAREIATAKALIKDAQHDKTLVLERLDTIITLARHASDLYEQSPDEAKKWLNQAMWDYFEIDLEDDNGTPLTQATYDSNATAHGALTEAAEAVLGLTRNRHAKNPRKPLLTEGSNVDHLAEPVGFEPTVPKKGTPP